MWCREIPFPRALIRPVAAIAAASMVIFVSHFRLFPVLDRNLDKEVAYVATIAAGVGIWIAVEVAGRQGRRLLAGPADRAGSNGSRRCPPAWPSRWTDPELVEPGRQAPRTSSRSAVSPSSWAATTSSRSVARAYPSVATQRRVSASVWSGSARWPGRRG